MPGMTTIDAVRREEAAEWLARLRSRSVTTGELADFAKWRRDPANAAAYRAAEAFWEQSATLADDPDILASLGAAQRRRRIARWWTGWWEHPARRWLTIGTSAVALAAFAAFLLIPATSPTYRTAIGERSVARLDDGTTVHLDADTIVTTQFRSRERHIRLDRGHAFFEVHHDASRPFVVVADGVTVTALGTRFEVDRSPTGVTVALIEGSVGIRSANAPDMVRLVPGESVEVVDGRIGTVVHGRAFDLTRWRQGRLSFRDTPLADAIATMNRYTDRPIIVRSSALANEPISGDFSTDDVDGFVSAVSALFGAQAVERSDAR